MYTFETKHLGRDWQASSQRCERVEEAATLACEWMLSCHGVGYIAEVRLLEVKD